MISSGRFLIPALLCSIGLITNHGHNESDCTIGERKMVCKFFSRLIKGHLSLEPQGINSELTHEEVSVLTERHRHMRISMTGKKHTMQMYVPPIIVLQGLPKDIYKLIITTLKQKPLDNGKMLLQVLSSQKHTENLSVHDFRGQECFLVKTINEQWGAQNRAGNANAGQGKPVKFYNCNGVGHIARNCTQPKRPQNSDYFKDKMLLMQA
ncbi:retrovirus-related pol polyprotein from transposon TNT 1-94 [Tanacetum coccineum]